MARSAEELRDMLAHRDTRGLRLFIEDSHPGRVAEALAQLEPAEIIHVLRHARKSDAIEVFEFFSEETQEDIFEGMARKEMAEFLEEMASDDRADLVKRLKPELAESVLALVAQVDREDIRRLSSYREGTAGAIMTTGYACLPVGITVAEAMERLRVQAPDRETIYYVYIVDDDRRLLGLVELKDLIVARPAGYRRVDDIMERDVISVSIKDDPIEVARTISKYDLISVPVVDGARRLVGIVTVDDAMDLLDPEADEPSAGGSDRSAASMLGYVDRAAWATNRARGLWVIAFALMVVTAWFVLRESRFLYALLTVVLGAPMLVAFGASPGARCCASTARDLVRERPVLASVVRNVFDELLFGFPPLIVIFVFLGLILKLHSGSPTHDQWQLLMAGGIAAVIQVIAAAILGGIVSVFARTLHQPPERVVSPGVLSAADGLAVLLYFAFVFEAVSAVLP